MNRDTDTIDLTDRASFLDWTPVTIRFSDQDPLGHVNNVAMAAYIETGRTMLIHKFRDPQRHPNLNYALVHMEIDYRAEFRYPGTIDVGACITRVGTKSFSSGYGLFLGERCMATATCVNVFFDTASRVSVEPPEEVRAALVSALEGKLP